MTELCWLELVAEQRDRQAWEDEIADGLHADTFESNLDEYGDDLGPDDESWRDEPETEW